MRKILDLPQMVNQKYLKWALNERIETFDSQNGIRSYISFFYQLFAFAFVVSMEYQVILNFNNYIEGNASTIEKVLSVLTFLVILCSAFPMAQIIRKRGDSFNNKHSSMIEFVFKDFIVSNIKLMGELIAIVALVGAVNLSISFVTDHDLFSSGSIGMEMFNLIAPIGSFPVNLLVQLLNSVGFEELSLIVNEINTYRINTSGELFHGDFIWISADLFIVINSYINVIIGLGMMYISISIYKYIYGIISDLLHWIANPSIPITIKNK